MRQLLFLALAGLAAVCPLAAQGVIYNPFPIGTRLVPTGAASSLTLSGTTDGSALCNIGGVLADCPPGSYAATMSSDTVWTITGATHELGTCDLTGQTWTVSGGIRTWAVGSGMECDEDDFDVRISWGGIATAGRVGLFKSGGGGASVGGGAPTAAKYWLAAADATLSAEKNLGALADNAIVAVDVAASEATPRAALYSDIIPLFNSGTCSGYLKSDGTCDTPAGAMSDGSIDNEFWRWDEDTGTWQLVVFVAGNGVTITHSSGQVTASVDCAQVGCLAQNNAYLGNNAYAGTTVQTPSATQTLVAGDAITVSTITFKSISAASGITLTSTPTIADGAAGQELILVNDGSNNITLQDEANLAGSNLCLPADTNITLAPKEALRGVMSVTSACWIFFR